MCSFLLSSYNQVFLLDQEQHSETLDRSYQDRRRPRQAHTIRSHCGRVCEGVCSSVTAVEREGDTGNSLSSLVDFRVQSDAICYAWCRKKKSRPRGNETMIELYYPALVLLRFHYRTRPQLFPETALLFLQIKLVRQDGVCVEGSTLWYNCIKDR